MTIGINAAAAIKQPRMGVEEYTYQLIKHLTMLPEAREHRFFLYVPSVKNKIPLNPLLKRGEEEGIFDFPLPENFEIKILRWPLPFLGTQIRLAWELLFRPIDILFIPVHVLPFFSPKNSVVTVHGLEYEYFPQYYSFWRRLYLRWGTKNALKRASKIIAVSESTKNDLIKFYGGKIEKIKVVRHGIRISDFTPPFIKGGGEGFFKKSPLIPLFKGGKYLLYLGRIEAKKNIQGILEAYKILKEEYKISHQLVLAGAPGFGYSDLKLKIDNLLKIVLLDGIPQSGKNCKLKIIELGYVSEDEKWQLLGNADVFLFPSFYEGFGLPILEAQATSVPVLTSFYSSMPEVAGEGALFVNPQNPAQIAEAIFKIIDDRVLRDRLIKSGWENIKRFSWKTCSRETLKILTE